MRIATYVKVRLTIDVPDDMSIAETESAVEGMIEDMEYDFSYHENGVRIADYEIVENEIVE